MRYKPTICFIRVRKFAFCIRCVVLVALRFVDTLADFYPSLDNRIIRRNKKLFTAVFCPTCKFIFPTRKFTSDFFDAGHFAVLILLN